MSDSIIERLGWYTNISNNEYHTGPGLSSTLVKKYLAKTPAEIQWEAANAKAPTENMKLGSAVHALLDSEKTFENEFAIQPELNLRTKHGREQKLAFEAENKDRTIITYETLETAQKMVANVKKHPKAAEFQVNTLKEQSIYWKETIIADEFSEEVLLKIRPDSIGPRNPLIFDYKTCQDASPGAMRRTILDYGYHISAALYLRGVNQCESLLEALGRDYYAGFCLVCVESHPPFQVACYEIGNQFLAEGEINLDTALRRYVKARAENYPSYSPAIRVIDAPSYSKSYDL